VRVAHVCMDRGVGPSRRKGAAVHLQAIRDSMRKLGAEVFDVDSPDADVVAARLHELHRIDPLDLVYERYSLGATTVSEFAEGMGIAHVLEVNAPLQAEASRYRGSEEGDVASSPERAVLGKAKLVVAVSSKVAEFAIDSGAPSENVVIEPNGVDPEMFNPGRAQELGAEAPVPAGRFTLGVHGRLRPWHNLEMLGRVAARLLDEDCDVHVLTIGKGDYAETLGALLPEERFTHLSWVPHPDVGRYVACFDALPLTYAPADDYFSPLKLREAMASGAVPVVPDVGDLAQDVGEAGIIYEPGSESELQEALRGLIQDPGHCSHLSVLAQRQAEGSDWLSIARRTLERALAVTL